MDFDDTAERSDDGSWQVRFLHAPSSRIAGGSDEIQRNIMGERVLGGSRGPRVGRDVAFRDLAGTPR